MDRELQNSRVPARKAAKSAADFDLKLLRRKLADGKTVRKCWHAYVRLYRLQDGGEI